MKKFLVVLIVLAALVATPTALAWHADGVTVTAECSEDTYLITASIDQSDEWPNAFVISVTPSSVAGNTSGSVEVTVVIGWQETNETQTFRKYISLDGECELPPPPPPPPPGNPPKDWCPNIPHTQQDRVPEGMVLDANGNCVTETPPIRRDPASQPTLPTTDPSPPPPAEEPPPPPPTEEPPPPTVTPEFPVDEPTPTPEQPKPEDPKAEPKPPKDELPFTGNDDLLPVLLGMLLVGAGLLLRKVAPAS